MDKELWVTIEGFENYQVSNYGRVKRLEHYINCLVYSYRLGKLDKPVPGVRHYSEKLLDISLSGGNKKKGEKGKYPYVRLTDSNGKQKAFAVHRLVAQYFIPNPDNKSEIDHIDRNPLNNRADNLRWVTRGENMSNTKAPIRTHYYHSEEFYKNHPNYKGPYKDAKLVGK